MPQMICARASINADTGASFFTHLLPKLNTSSPAMLWHTWIHRLTAISLNSLKYQPCQNSNYCGNQTNFSVQIKHESQQNQRGQQMAHYISLHTHINFFNKYYTGTENWSFQYCQKQKNSLEVYTDSCPVPCVYPQTPSICTTLMWQVQC